MTEKQIIRQLLAIIGQATLPIQGAALGQVMNVLQLAEQVASAPDAPAAANTETPNGPAIVIDDGVLVGDGESD